MWSQEYNNLIERNIGLLTHQQQEILEKSCIAIFGLGGLGGVISQILCRSGICSFKIVDNDRFEHTNLNRQIFSFKETVGRLKIDVTEEFLKKINPQVKIEKYLEVTEENIDKILKGVDIAILALDSVKPCLIISRATQSLKIPLIEGWALPILNVRVFTENTPSLEEAYNLPTIGKAISSISDEEFKELKNHMLSTLKKIEGIEKFYPPWAIKRIREGKIPSFAPMVWLTATVMSLEAIKILLSWGKIPLSPKFSLYNPFDHTIPKQEV